MRSYWGMVDRLCRELGRLRDEARAIHPRGTDAAVIAELDAALARAADAIDATIDSPEERHLFLGACEAVARVRRRLRELEATGTLVEEGARIRSTSLRLTLAG